MIATTCLWAPLVVMTFPLSYPKRYDFAVVWCRMILFWLKFTCKLDYRITGLENIPNQPVVILSKHQSTWETLTLARLFSPQVWVLKRELLFIPFFGWGLAMLQPIARSANFCAVSRCSRCSRCAEDQSSATAIKVSGSGLNEDVITGAVRKVESG